MDRNWGRIVMIGTLSTGIYGVGVPPVTAAYENIATATGTGSSGTVTFSSIPSTYKHLQVRIMGFQSTSNDVFVKLNSDAGVKAHYVQADGSSVITNNQTGTSSGQYLGTWGWKSTNPSVYVLDLLDYTSTSKAKTIRGICGLDENGSGRFVFMSAFYTTTSVIDTITFTSGNSYSTNSHFGLYGIKD